MKIYKFNFTKIMLTLLIISFFLAIFGFAVNIYRMINFENATTYNYITVILMLFITVFLTIVVISVLISSKYTLTKQKLICRYGIIKSTILLKNITQITHFKKTDKLVIYFDTDKYSVIVIKSVYYDDFIKTIMQFNSKIIYDSKEEAENTLI